jgi:hypothetical protein
MYMCGPNPNPFNFEIIKHYSNKVGTVLMVNYPNCTNYEGNKILVYLGTSYEELKMREELDPHFFDGGDSPCARFEPIEDGWEYAIQFLDLKKFNSELFG